MKNTGLGDEGMRKRLSQKDVVKLRPGPMSIYPGKEEGGKGRETSIWVQRFGGERTFQKSPLWLQSGEWPLMRTRRRATSWPNLGEKERTARYQKVWCSVV